MKLIIFDLDQTLVDFIAVHDESNRWLFQQLFGVDARLTEIDFAGRSLTDNFSELARLKGVAENLFKVKLPELLQSYDRVFDKCIPTEGEKYVLPGVKKLLNGLTKAGDMIMLYTGDSHSVVKSVFRVTGIGKYFVATFYGTEVTNRVDMVRSAIQKAEKMTGRIFQGKEIVIIGDSVRDIECGKEFNALTIAVATGFHSLPRLEAAKPDYVFGNLRDYKKILQILK